METIRKPKFLRALFILQAAIWVIVGVFFVVSLFTTSTPLLTLLIAVGMFLYAGWLLWVGHHLGRGSRTAYLLAVATSVFTILATIFDDVGLADLLFLAFAVFVFFAVLYNWPVYMSKTAG
jgi:hypothetical protein